MRSGGEGEPGTFSVVQWSLAITWFTFAASFHRFFWFNFPGFFSVAYEPVVCSTPFLIGYVLITSNIYKSLNFESV